MDLFVVPTIGFDLLYAFVTADRLNVQRKQRGDLVGAGSGVGAKPTG